MTQTPPRPTVGGRGGRSGRGGSTGRGGHGGQYQDFDGPPLKKSENRWMPIRDTSALVVTEKKVKSILNKMTKEKFDKLSEEMCNIPILSYEMLTMMIHHVYEKAICEPSFGDMYAQLCVRLSYRAKNIPFVKIIESDEEPPTDDGTDGFQDEGGTSSGNTVYRWTNDVNTDDSEIVGPFDSPENCIFAALDEEACSGPVKRGSMELTLHSLKIRQGMFIKIMHSTQDPSKFFAVFFAVSQAEEAGQQMSKIFLSERECVLDSRKNNSFKRILLYKCEDEFNKQDIYEDLKQEKKAYEENKSSLTDVERLEQEEELEFRRMKIKKQMLGNIRFIGELYKIDMLKEKIMHYCIKTLLKLGDKASNDTKSNEDDEMDDDSSGSTRRVRLRKSTKGRILAEERYGPWLSVVESFYGHIVILVLVLAPTASEGFIYKRRIILAPHVAKRIKFTENFR